MQDAIREAQTIVTPREAEAIALYDVTDIEITKGGRAKLQVRIAYKKNLGRDGEHFSTMYIPISPFVKVSGLKGWLVKVNGKCLSLKKRDIAIIGMSESVGYYDDNQVMIATLPDVNPGDVVAFEYTVTEKGWTSLFQGFTFQVQQPVQYARFSMLLPDEWQLHKAEQRTSDVVQFTQTGNQYSWTARNLELQPEEPLAPSWSRLSRRVAVAGFDPESEDIHHFPDWGAVARWCADVHRPPAAASKEVADEAIKLTQGLGTFEEKLRAISTFCQEEIRYVAIEIGKGRWVPRPASEILHTRYGDCKDKVTLMRAMLQSVGITSVPVLAGVKNLIHPQLVTPFQFNHCIIGIPLDETSGLSGSHNSIVGKWLFFDPTDPIADIGSLPRELQGSRVLLGAPDDSILIHLPYASPRDNRRVLWADVTLSEEGALSGAIKISDFGSWAAQTRHERRTITVKKQIESWHGMISQSIPNIELTSYRTGGEGDSVWLSLAMRGEYHLQATGNYYLFKPDIFHTPETPELLADHREHPIWFGAPMRIESRITWHLPDDWVMEIDTAAVQISCRAASVYTKTTISGGILTYESIEQQNGQLMQPAEYPSARAFSQGLSSTRGQTILVQKKKDLE
ncbi:MAG: DUF3857 domain-containing protein [Fidelibacterota bacterium]|nr:MAG: DUF3857 domain-containing protein [Candidatus Neomarinimicrobiota bacterium]